MVKAECSACGYIVRTTAKWLDSLGAPLCPCNGEPMGDCREGLGALSAPDDRGPGAFRTSWRVLPRGRSERCWLCDQFHDSGALMVLEQGSVRGRIETRHYCAEACGETVDYSGDVPPWAPVSRSMAA